MKRNALSLLVLLAVISLDRVHAQNCSTTPWSTWTCSVTCGNGSFTRSRNCITNTGAVCSQCSELSGASSEGQSISCIREPCPFCSWTPYAVQPCSTTCGAGFRLQTRECRTTDGRLCGTCTGSDFISESCPNQPACPEPCGVNSHFEQSYLDCGTTCQSRQSTCITKSNGCVCNPGYFLDSPGGRCIAECDCGCFDSMNGHRALNEVWNGTCSTYICNTGGEIDTIASICSTSVMPMPIAGGWSDWTDPSPMVCAATCGDGVRPQYRTCTNPMPQQGGASCTGSGVRLVNCTSGITCPGSDMWSTWSTYSGCSVTCGNGTRTAYRNCTRSTLAAPGDAACNGSNVDTMPCYAGPCPMDGAWTAFSTYSTCSAICSPGSQASRRNCMNQTAGGSTCSGSGLQFQTCSGVNDAYQCNATGFWSEYTSFSACSVSCGVGFQYRTRQCAGAGFGCVGEAIDTVTCNTTVPCPIDGTWSNWTAWSSCPTTCGTATIYRTRTCSGAMNGGLCVGSALETQLCDTSISCSPIPYNSTDGQYSSWSTWSPCTSTCGMGSQTRTRSCTNPLPSYGGRYCSGSPIEIASCNATQVCPANGNWSPWRDWSSCSGTCGNGIRSRVRLCANPSPAYGGRSCEGAAVETSQCSTNIDCPVDGVWGNWVLSTACFGTCGNGTRVYTRTCTPPIGGGLMCLGSTRREETCDLNQPCPVDGNWGVWGSFTACSVTCGAGVYSRVRECNNPMAAYGGNLCIGSPLETATCLTNVTCPTHGGWTSWSGWADCSSTCAGGLQKRTRTCTNPTPANNGMACVGSGSDYQTCNDNIPCVALLTANPINGTWGPWTEWMTCSGTCGNGTQTRYRNCSGEYNGGYPCMGSALQSQSCVTGVPCPTNGGWSDYSAFGPCSATCGNGVQVRTRNCNQPAPQNGGEQCIGASRDTSVCTSNVMCPIDGGWSNWTESVCSSTCGTGYRVRQRNCSNPPPQFGGSPCIGLSLDTILCTVPNVPCPTMGQWTAWSDATNCSATCGSGVIVRNRTCQPADATNCIGDTIRVDTCDSGRSCALPTVWNSVVGNWSQWSAWSSCSVSCGNGTQYQTRACNDSSPSRGGSLCRGDPLRTRDCTTNTPCPSTGNWTEWANYSACSTTCGTGVRTQIRYCNNTNNFNELCVGPALRTTLCNQDVTCPTAGVWGVWTDWSTCSGSCGTGLRVKTRLCNVTTGGDQCSGLALDAQSCNTNITCPVDGGWGNWTEWTNCSSGSCAAGSSYRFRNCNNPPPSNGGQLCAGDAMETNVCRSAASCPVNGNWATWGDWSACSSTCMGGRRSRQRTCSNPASSNGGLSCVGSSVEVDGTCASAMCGINPVVRNGAWSNWASWSDCATTCGVGMMRRVRTCNTTGSPCVGSNFEMASCNSSINCPVDGVWGAWNDYSQCTASCGVGMQTRTRMCTNQADGGLPCFGSPTQTIVCNTNIPCPIDGQWTSWSSSSPCSASCGVGYSVRTRTCSQVAAAFGGVSCPGSSILRETCSAAQNCSIDGQWGSWTPWSPCSATCGKSATKYSTRLCNNPAPLYGGNGCEGAALRTVNCTELADCPVCPMTQYLAQSAPSTCPASCNAPDGTDWCKRGTWTPKCLCQSPYAWESDTNTCVLWCNCGCYGKNNQKYAIGTTWTEDNCRMYQCMQNNGSVAGPPRSVVINDTCTSCLHTSWSAWSSCSATCGQGSQTRNRTCVTINSNSACSTCTGSNTQTQLCLQTACEVCQFGPWMPLESCSKTCDNGTQSANRSCLNIAATSSPVPIRCSNSSGCQGFASDRIPCATNPCPPCTWSPWIGGECSVTCETGIYPRRRVCREPNRQSCTRCAPNPNINDTRQCFYPQCPSVRSQRSVTDWIKSWFK